MTPAATAVPCTLDDLKRDIAGLLLLLAAGAEPDVSECLPCAKAIEDRCALHAEDAAKALRLARTAEAVRKAQDRDEIRAALELAGDDSR